ncbi:MAG: CDP-diacylglycerol--glycerol-3-phosphate 3-phosphatidyltransferase [Rhodoluna sp.]|nr:CDP-diacylglycerol--glycerol-3-phosphate 3-phosphatidyltransferase [Rhodoluna sp.]MBP7818535.1 CDP-diacylglycerol--glycerol-3-phosphate 3-phosphatidyltransferase [Rhodoluna sp.]
MSNMLKTTATSKPWNLPNAITAARILAVPFFIWSLVSISNDESPMRWVSVLIFIIIMASDGVDGAIARKRGIVTDLGKLLDPIADKALLGGALVTLSILGEIAWWVTIVILVRELGITAYRLVVVNQKVIAASSGGKLKTIFQGVMVGFVVSPLTAWFPFEWYFLFEDGLVLTSVILTVYSGLQYVAAAVRARG